jgi:thymidylate kinase
MIIIIFGPDCTGKDSVRHELSKLMNYDPWIIVRSPICNMVYDKLYKRKNNEVYLSIIIELFSRVFDTKWIFLTANSEELVKRGKLKNEKHLTTISEAKKQLNLYIKYFNKYKKSNFYRFDTTNKKVEQVTKEIYDEIK